MAAQLGSIRSTSESPANEAIVPSQRVTDRPSRAPALRKTKGMSRIRAIAAEAEAQCGTTTQKQADGQASRHRVLKHDRKYAHIPPSSLSTDLTDFQLDQLTISFARSKLIETSINTTLWDSADDWMRHQPLSVPEFIELSLPPIFDSLCICDSNIMGSPIRLHSHGFSLGPRGLTVGCCKFLNMPFTESEAKALTVQGSDDGRPRVFLEVATSLLDQRHGQRTFVVASQIDVTHIVRKVAVLEAFYEKAMHESSENTVTVNMDNPTVDMNWLELGLSEDEGRPESSGPLFDGTAVRSPHMWSFLHLIERIGSFYRHFFILLPAASSTAPTSAVDRYAITYVSPAVLQSKPDLDANVSATEPAVLSQLGKDLAKGQRVAVNIKWGVMEESKWLICNPMTDNTRASRSVVWWLCFLIDKKLASDL